MYQNVHMKRSSNSANIIWFEFDFVVAFFSKVKKQKKNYLTNFLWNDRNQFKILIVWKLNKNLLWRSIVFLLNIYIHYKEISYSFLTSVAVNFTTRASRFTPVMKSQVVPCTRFGAHTNRCQRSKMSNLIQTFKTTQKVNNVRIGSMNRQLIEPEFIPSLTGNDCHFNVISLQNWRHFPSP